MKNRTLLTLISFFFLFSCSKKEVKKDFIEDLISKMTLQEKAGQLNFLSYTFSFCFI
ncbi:hypothetical protein M4I21_10760 [Cellulophaga sp. 20_2_10]|uniref:hypothetical protein n=1 Tax=Cellulophaga sp. 20_2_10 TaxID=2942476 RepID=UPI00201A76FE|nr:hypothetical protein [Cellulophaga sp. 20_2_10]MCL5246291.1 hypothetical protein [Cellulophaga sp. 20_2_10]